MTTIKSSYGKELKIETYRVDPSKVALSCAKNDHNGNGEHDRIYSRADLLAALEDDDGLSIKWYADEPVGLNWKGPGTHIGYTSNAINLPATLLHEPEGER